MESTLGLCSVVVGVWARSAVIRFESAEGQNRRDGGFSGRGRRELQRRELNFLAPAIIDQKKITAN